MQRTRRNIDDSEPASPRSDEEHNGRSIPGSPLVGEPVHVGKDEQAEVDAQFSKEMS